MHVSSIDSGYADIEIEQDTHLTVSIYAYTYKFRVHKNTLVEIQLGEHFVYKIQNMERNEVNKTAAIVCKQSK